jgi:hypothetical protein
METARDAIEEADLQTFNSRFSNITNFYTLIYGLLEMHGTQRISFKEKDGRLRGDVMDILHAVLGLWNTTQRNEISNNELIMGLISGVKYLEMMGKWKLAKKWEQMLIDVYIQFGKNEKAVDDSD